MISEIGILTGTEMIANELNEKIKRCFSKLEQENKQTLRTAYLIWKNPYMTIGGDTFINDLLKKAGFKNVFENQKRYPETTVKQLQDFKCELILLSSEPYPFQQKHIDELKVALPHCKIILVDGEMFSWYGSRLLQSTNYFKKLQIFADN
jgi:ABC-type Fe3+-hydroxamate transport system substrate-binding protein